MSADVLNSLQVFGLSFLGGSMVPVNTLPAFIRNTLSPAHAQLLVHRIRPPAPGWRASDERCGARGAFLSWCRMLANLLTNLLNPEYLLYSPLMLLGFAFQIWMFVDAIRRQEWIWAVFIFFFSLLSALLYFFLVYRAAAQTATRGFELPGAHDRKRIKELQAQIHHLDKAHHHSQLGDIYFQQGQLERAEACYRAAIERDPEEPDTRAHLGQCLLRRNRPADAKPLLEGVITANPTHDYGHTLMALAETYQALGDTAKALAAWKQVTQNHSYARARVQLAELLASTGQPDLAKAELREVIEEDTYAPSFQRKKDRVWIRRAKARLGKL
ncbi:MAG: tetratricopeptide repeat protein [Verrucomicrobia bacterium]|nr:tetratricopeptide repeat protein [Verrucomicrobiota bacterium]